MNFITRYLNEDVLYVLLVAWPIALGLFCLFFVLYLFNLKPWVILYYPVYCLGWLFAKIVFAWRWLKCWEPIREHDWQRILDAEQKRSRKASIAKANDLKAAAGNFK